MNQNNFDNLPSVDIADSVRVMDRFIDILMSIHHKPIEEATAIYEKEALYYRKALLTSDKLWSCTNISLFGAFLEVAVNCLSIQPGAKSEAFMESRGTKQPDGTYVNSASLAITAYGELNMRIRSGQIIRMSNPQVIYDGDHFQPKTNARGELTVDYQPSIPRKSSKIIGCYVCVVLPNDGLDFKWLLEDDIERLKKASIPKGKTNGTANALYSANAGQIDPGFLEAKTIKHAMRAYTKLRLSDSAKLDDEEQPEDSESQKPAEQQVFGEELQATAQQPTQGVTVIDKEDVF